MGINKRYYWLKLKNDFFTDKRIKKLRKIAGGDTYTIIYLKMQLLSLKDEGKLYFDNIEESFEEEIALQIDEDVDDTKITIQYLINSGLLVKKEIDEYLLTETVHCIGSETQVAERVRNYRERQKLLQCNTNVTNGNTEKEIEKEKDKEIDIYTQVEVELNMTLSPSNYEKINYLVSKYGEDKVIEAVKTASNGNKKSLNYVEGILKNNNFKKQDIKPNWLNEEIKADKELTEEEINEMKDLLKEFE